MKNQKSILLSMVMVLTVVLSGCASKGSDPVDSSASTSSPSTSSTESPKASKLDPYKLVMVYPNTKAKDLNLVQDEINKYLTEKINATIELKPIDWGAWNDKANLMFTSNEEFDVMFAASYLSYNSNVTKGQFIQIDDLLNKYGQGAKDTLGADWIKGSQINGHSYGVPTLKEFAGSAGLLFRKDLVAKYNIDLNAIKTLDDLTPIFQKIKDKEPGVTPLVQSGTLNFSGLMTGYSLDMLGDSYGVIDPDSSDMKVVNLLETKKYTDIVYQMRSWNQAGLLIKMRLL